ncbi:MAG: RelA/SpoT family protein [Gammaproteobacteria bacterium]
MATIESLTKRLESYLPPEQVDLVRRAYHYAREAHEGQFRQDGDPYISHPLAVAGILTDMHMDAQSLAAALMHDVLEDCGVSKDQLATQFGDEVAELVDGVSKITMIEFPTRAEQQAENLRKMILAMTRDIRVILVKLADRLHNMRTLQSLPPTKRRRIAQETLDIFGPIANRLGMNNIRVEYEDLAFTAMYPMRAQRIGRAVRAVRGNRREVVTKLKETMETLLRNEGIEARILGREKHLYSIYCKMREQKKSFDEIMDFYGFRVIVDKVDTCYRVLGILHNYFKPIPGRFKDYIAIPKANGYQSLHTTLKSHAGVPIEVQVRTEDMENMANNGIAAHWIYKSDDKEPVSGPQSRARQWMKGLLDIQKQVGNSVEFIENVKIDLFPDEVYVFTPRGDIMELPTGATPVDFAYAVHTSVGSSCVAARVDHRLVPLSTPLTSGQTVEVITAPGGVPSPAWLNFVVTSKARTYIRNFLKGQRRGESVALGQRLLEQALGEYGVVVGDLPIERVVGELAHGGYAQLDDLLEDIGLGNRAAPLVARQLGAIDDLGAFNASGRPLAIRGTEGMVITYAKCCHPLPGDEIVGHLSAGRGLVVHRDNCRNLVNELRENPERCLPLRWEKSVQGDFPVELRVELSNRRGALATLATIVAENDSNIDGISIVEKDAQIGVVSILISVHDRVHLALIIKRLRRVPGVGKISRGKA